MITWKIEKRKISDLKGYKKNPRKFTEKGLKDLKKSLENLGDANIITINSNNTILGGHARIQVMKELGYDEVDVKVPDRLLNEKEVEETCIRLNANSAGEWDFDLLNDFDSLDLAEWGLDIEFPQEEEAEIIEDDVPQVKENICKRGDVWQLDKHRVMCGDSTIITEVEKLMNGNKADMVFTDPPYGMKKEKDGVLNDNLNYDDLLEFNKQWIPLSFSFTKINGSWYCWGIDEPLMDIYGFILKPLIKNKQIAFRNLITWNKGNGQGQLSKDFRKYPIADEKCLFVMCGSESCQGFSVNAEDYSENMDKVRLYLEGEIKKINKSDKEISNALGYKDGRTVNHWYSKSQFALPTRENYEKLREYGHNVLKDCGFLKKDYDFLKKDYDELKKDYYESRSYFDNTHDNMNNVWSFARTNGKEKQETEGHPTTKPIELCSRAILSSSREGETVLDLFGGSGSVLIACEQLNRKCFMMELDEHYCDVIIQRWENLTGKKAKLLND